MLPLAYSAVVAINLVLQAHATSAVPARHFFELWLWLDAESGYGAPSSYFMPPRVRLTP
jgi:hypothetical protein